MEGSEEEEEGGAATITEESDDLNQMENKPSSAYVEKLLEKLLLRLQPCLPGDTRRPPEP